MTKRNNLVILSGNQSKIAEFERLLGADLESVKIDLVEIQSTDAREVAKHKAVEAFKHLGKPCFVDDTGLTIHQWGNLPGALIKWFLEEVGNAGIVAMLGDNPREATVTTAIGYCGANGPQVFVGELRKHSEKP